MRYLKESRKIDRKAGERICLKETQRNKGVMEKDKRRNQPTRTVSLSRNLYWGTSILVGAGPLRMRPDASKWEP